MSIRQPEVERCNRCLDQEAAGQQGKGEENKRVVAGAERQPDLRHVQCPGYRIQQGDAGKLQESRNRIGDGKGERTLERRWLLRLKAA
jgi:hypothetical protein